MIKTNLIAIIKKLDQKELKEFSEFVKSPFFNKNDSVIKLYEYIRKQFPDYEEGKLEKEFVFGKLFGRADYNDGFMRTLVFNLTNLTEEYLKYVNFKRNQAEQVITILDELKLRKIDKVFLKNYNDAIKVLDRSAYKSSDYYLYNSVLDDLIDDFTYLTRYKNKNLQDFTLENFRDSVEHLSHFYLIKVLNKYRFLLAKQYTIPVDIDFRLVENIVEFLKNNETLYVNDPIIRLHLNEILLMKERREESYIELKKLLLEGQSVLDIDQRYSLHNILHMHCLEMTYAGKTEYLNERFELYKIALKQNIIKGSEDRYIDAILFGNIMLTALKLKKVEWAEDFVKKYTHELAPENMDGMMGFCSARIKFSKGEFNESLKLLNSIQSFNHIQYKIAIRDLIMLNYYELSFFSQAYSFLDSHRHFLNKNRHYFSDERFSRETNFMKFYIRILKMKEKYSSNELINIKADLEKVSGVIERDWLTDKLNELEK
jgi:hypothetical protein